MLRTPTLPPVPAVLAALAVLAVLATISTPALANAGPQRAELTLVSAGGTQAALALSTDLQVDVTGLIARTTLRHRFRNPSGDWVEGRYQFPLPDGAAVDTLRIEIGERLIEGRIEPRETARRTFKTARASGRTAGLVEQQRPGLFTTDVTNIGPGEDVTVEIGFAHRVDYRNARFTLNLPMTLVPRFHNPGPSGVRVVPGDVPAAPDYAPSPQPGDAPNAAAAPVNPLRLRVDLRPGPELATLDSLHHAVALQPTEAGGWTVTLDERDAVVDRDFELEWTLMERDRLTGGFYVEEFEGRTHALLMLVPPPAWAPVQRRRELVLVIDASGSMQGEAIEQARNALLAALERLQPGDRFNVIAFSNHARPLFDSPRFAAPSALAEARTFLRLLQADGGTRMDTALVHALDPPIAGGYLRQVVFATDGAVANEHAVLDQVRARIGESRVFAVGIGHGVNAPFLAALARDGRGSLTRIADPRRLARDVGELMDQLEHPALEGLELDWPVADEAWPVLLPDLYAGEALMVLTRLDAPLDALIGEHVTLHAERAGRAVTHSWPLADFRIARGVAREWARQKVDGVLDFARSDVDPEGLEAFALSTALAYQVLSPLTSLVAVDTTPRRSAEAALKAARTRHNPPHGRMLALPQTATDAPRSLAAALVALLLAGLLLAAPRLGAVPATKGVGT